MNMRLLKNNELETTIFICLENTPIKNLVTTYGFTRRKIGRDKAATFTIHFNPNCIVYEKLPDIRDTGYRAHDNERLPWKLCFSGEGPYNTGVNL